MSGDLSMFVTSVTTSGAHIKLYTQLNTEKYASLDNMITANADQFDVNTLNSLYELLPGETVLVKVASGGSPKWYRARVNNIQSTEFATVAVQFIDYGTNEVVHCSQICLGRAGVAAAILTQPPMAVECVLAEVVPAHSVWSEAAVSYLETQLLGRVVSGKLVRQDANCLHVRVFGPDGVTSMSQQLVSMGLGRPAQTGAVPPGAYQGAELSVAPPVSVPPPSVSPLEYAERVKEMTTAPAQPGSEGLVTICHYSSGPAKFAIQNHHQRAALQQLMADIQAYCSSSPPVPLNVMEPGVVCLGASASREGRFLRGVITHVDGSLVKVYWADFGHDESKHCSEVRAMPRQFAAPWIQASRVSLAGIEALTPVPGRQQLFREITEGKLLSCKFRAKEQQNQVDLYEMDVSVLDRLVQLGAYSAGPMPSSPSPLASASLGDPLSTMAPSAHVSVLIVAVSAINNLYLRLAETAPQLQNMLDNMSQVLTATGVPVQPGQARVGLLCAVFKDGWYQRARVVSVGRRDVKVQFVDLGTSELVANANLKQLEPRFSTIPPQAVHCCLAGLESQPGVAENVRYLQSLCPGHGATLLCQVVGQQGDKRVVRLTDNARRPPLDINAAVRDHIVASAAVEGGAPPSQQIASVTKPQVSLGSRERLVVMYCEPGTGRWFGQLAKLDEDAMFAMEEAMQRAYGSGQVGPPASVPVGTFCAAKSTLNDAFYRAKVVSRQGSQVQVQYIDYGDKELKPLSEIYALLPEFTRLPQLGIYCSLSGGGGLSAEALSASLQDQTLEVVLHSCQADVYEVALSEAPENAAVRDQLRRAGYTEPNVSSSQRPGPIGAPSSGLSTQRLNIGSHQDVEVVHVVSPAEFYVQLKEQFGAIEELQEAMSGYGRVSAPPSVSVGQLVAALYPDDSAWYRGRVTAQAGSKVTVFFIDYGDTRQLSASEVRPLRPEHCRLPAQAVRCCTRDAHRAGLSNYPEEQVAQFRAAVLEQAYLARPDQQCGDTAVVTLTQAGAVSPMNLPQTQPRQHGGGPAGRPQPRADQDMNWRSSAGPAGDRRSPRSDGDKYAGKCRMDIPESYSRPKDSRSRPSGPGGPGGPGGDAGWGGGGSSGQASEWPGSRPPRGSRPEQQPRGFQQQERSPQQQERGPQQQERGPQQQERGPQHRQQREQQQQERGPQQQERGPQHRQQREQQQQERGPQHRQQREQQQQPAVVIPEHSGRLSPSPLPPGQSVRVTPTWVCGLHEFFLQPLEGGDKFSSLMTEMQDFYNGLRRQDGVENSPAVGKPLAARYTDGAWYRATTTSISPTELAVHFVDYGNSCTVDARAVKRLKQEFCQLPRHAYRCQFAGIQPAGGKWKVLPEKQLAKYFEAEMQVTVLGGSGDAFPVEATLASGLRVADQLVADGLAVRVAASQPVQQQNIGTFPALERTFSAGERVAVFVSYIISPQRFYVQLSENTAEIDNMAAQIEASTADCKVSCADVQPEEICLAPFEEVYYRGVISSVAGSDVTVYFVDYGNTETMPASELLECPMPLVDLPAQALACSLTGVSSDCADQLTERADQMELTALVDRVLPSWLGVTLLDGNTNLNLALGGRPGSATASPSPKRSSASPPKPVSSPQHKPAPAAAEESQLAAEPYRRCVVSFVVSPHEFYVQDAADKPTALLDEVMAQLETEYTELGPEDRAVQQMKVGDVVAAPFSEDGVFYRASILSVDAAADSCQLQFIDYGNSESTARSALKALTPKLREPAAMAMRCCLLESPVDGKWSSEVNDTFEELVGTAEKQLTLESVGGDEHCWLVNLKDGEADIGAAMVRMGLALPPGIASAPAAAASPAAASPAKSAGRADAADGAAEPADLPDPAGPVGLARLQTGRLQDALVVFALSATDFWVQLSQDTAGLDALMAHLEASELTPDPAASVGDLVVARWADDGALYRAKVLSASPPSLTVSFIDYGNTETVTASSDVYKCPSSLVDIPGMAFRCTLPLEPQAWPEAAVDEFSRLVGVGGEEEKVLKLELVRSGKPATVNLFDGEEDVAFAMVGAGFGTVHVEEPSPPALLKQADTLKTELSKTAARDSPVEEQPAEQAAAAQEASTVASPAEDNTAAVLVSHVESPLQLYVQSADTTVLDDLMERLAAWFESAEVVESPQPGQLLAAQYSEDGLPYRARVRSVTDEKAEVFFVDYGNSERVPVSELKALQPALAAVPAQARHCQLAVQACSTPAADKLRQLTEDQQLSMLVLAEGVASRVKLALPGGEDVAEALVSTGLCRVRVPIQLSPTPPPPQGEHQVLVSHIETPSCFYVQQLDAMARLDELLDLLDELYSSPVASLALPCVGDLCVVRSPEDDTWYRAEVEAPAVPSAEGALTVRLVDYGSSVTSSEVKEPTVQVCGVPALAYRCRLPATPAIGDDWDQEHTSAFAEISTRADNTYRARLAVAGGELVAHLTLCGRPVTRLLLERGVELKEDDVAATDAQEEAAKLQRDAASEAALTESANEAATVDSGEEGVEKSSESEDGGMETENKGTSEASEDDDPSSQKPSEEKNKVGNGAENGASAETGNSTAEETSRVAGDGSEDSSSSGVDDAGKSISSNGRQGDDSESLKASGQQEPAAAGAAEAPSELGNGDN